MSVDARCSMQRPTSDRLVLDSLDDDEARRACDEIAAVGRPGRTSASAADVVCSESREIAAADRIDDVRRSLFSRNSDAFAGWIVNGTRCVSCERCRSGSKKKCHSTSRG
jgi:hypothetical protein